MEILKLLKIFHEIVILFFSFSIFFYLPPEYMYILIKKTLRQRGQHHPLHSYTMCKNEYKRTRTHIPHTNARMNIC